jgi:Arc/MetJ-type ribon-helix-helix transcriptional regulator
MPRNISRAGRPLEIDGAKFVGVNLDTVCLAIVDRHIKEGHFRNRSEGIRDLIITSDDDKYAATFAELRETNKDLKDRIEELIVTNQNQNRIIKRLEKSNQKFESLVGKHGAGSFRRARKFYEYLQRDCLSPYHVGGPPLKMDPIMQWVRHQAKMEGEGQKVIDCETLDSIHFREERDALGLKTWKSVVEFFEEQERLQNNEEGDGDKGVE